MTLFNLFKQTEIELAAEIIFILGRSFENPEELRKHLEKKVTEEELHEINRAALKEGKLPLVFIP